MPNIRHELIIAAPAAKVFDAIVTEEGLSSWWTSKTRATAAIGAVSRFDFGSNYFKEMRVIRLEQPTEIVWECISGADEWMGTILRFNLTDGEREYVQAAHPEIEDQLEQLRGFRKATVLAFGHEEWRKETPMFAECNYTWGRFLRGLKDYCETGKGMPWPHQHQSLPDLL